jgi:hypothetical protein
VAAAAMRFWATGSPALHSSMAVLWLAQAQAVWEVALQPWAQVQVLVAMALVALALVAMALVALAPVVLDQAPTAAREDSLLALRPPQPPLLLHSSSCCRPCSRHRLLAALLLRPGRARAPCCRMAPPLLLCCCKQLHNSTIAVSRPLLAWRLLTTTTHRLNWKLAPPSSRSVALQPQQPPLVLLGGMAAPHSQQQSRSSFHTQHGGSSSSRCWLTMPTTGRQAFQGSPKAGLDCWLLAPAWLHRHGTAVCSSSKPLPLQQLLVALLQPRSSTLQHCSSTLSKQAPSWLPQRSQRPCAQQLRLRWQLPLACLWWTAAVCRVKTWRCLGFA